MQWVKYSERKPDSAGVYMWRMGSRKVKGLVVIARAKFRLRGAGYEDVLSPEFDRWDGYSVVVPGELQWAEDDGSLPDISFENLPDATECPFCKRQPVIKAFEWDRGCRIGPEPYILNQFLLKCCGWIAPVTFDSPISAIESWNSKLSK
ncbi:hypothetical protein [Enterobacter kobei]|uniref:hypothetical protein n=1 Tax=Enterobacter kobei TaxID=208224 RepID=UPI000FCBEC25|nr:hypothetical protein [Enterobacter kobei]ELJ2672900.1 hypothetical protein [Citrobacter freundii]MDU2942055.1 hypothetical protein [Enterobacteriaceae bacterium]HCT5190001.1 hypothetical protein [Enterobacter roggenkampii]WIK03609.1 hypothetical protein OI922_21635 [Citrobacter freundii]HCT5200063.1 hypothetical protein [Enterobacter roggenkampii]